MTEQDIDWAEFLIYRHDVALRPEFDECERCEGMGFLAIPFAWLLEWPWNQPECGDCLGTGERWPGREVVRKALMC